MALLSHLGSDVRVEEQWYPGLEITGFLDVQDTQKW